MSHGSWPRTTPFLRRKSLAAADPAVAPAGGHGLKRSLGVWRLALIGVSSTIGTGIFFIFSVATPLAGPAVVLAFLVAGLAAALSALCYAELASAAPTAGSAYTAAYAALGEGLAFVLAACLLLEYGVATAAIAVTWAQYLNEFGRITLGTSLPHALSAAPSEGGLINLPAVALVALVTALLVRGVRESATANAIMVAIKVGVLAVFVLAGAAGFNAANLHPFMPNGFSGVGAAASLIFFAFIGIDSIATAGEEAINPRRTLPLAILLAFLIVTVVYLSVAIVAVGAQPAEAFRGAGGNLAAILAAVTGARWPTALISAGAVVSIFSIALVLVYSQTRVLFAVSRDGLLPAPFSRVNPRTGAPVTNTVTVAAIAAVMSGFLPLGVLAEMVSVGTLGAFILVAVSVIVLRLTQPPSPQQFRLPLFPVIPLASIGLCLYLLTGLAGVTLWMFAGWLAASVAVYLLYGAKRSRLAQAPCGSGAADAG
ncbi:APC family permease [Camelimonas abortus]|uniref:APC family permease n=1 Tax=Camelimonas abortus TaxID=1017184 RepID=A0ABV7LAR7_9HYPH